VRSDCCLMSARALIVVLSLLAVALAGCVAEPLATSDAGTAAAATQPELSEATHDLGEFLVQKVPGYDGTPLHVEVRLPAGEGPFPVILQYTPYAYFGSEDAEGTLNEAGANDAARETTGDPLLPDAFVERYVSYGYAVATAHVRGTGQSGGCLSVGGPEEGKDGYALVEWFANQSWSTGKLAIIGTSYVGTTQLNTALYAPPHLSAIVSISAVSEWYRYYFENGEPRFFGELPTGVVYTDPVVWAALGATPQARNPGNAADRPGESECTIRHAEENWAQDDYDAYWQARDYTKDIGNVTTPLLYAHGFRDENTPTTLVPKLFNPWPAEKRMWLQQHGHGVPGSFEPFWDYVHRWMDFYLLERDNGALDQPAVVVQNNLGQYYTLPEWPLRDAPQTLLHLGPDGLSASVPADGEASYRDDPRAMSELQALGVPADGTFLRFDTAALDEPLHLSGEARLELVAASSATDTQFAALLFDIGPDGSETFVTRGYLDARHADSLVTGNDITPGQAAFYGIPLHPRDHLLEAGHQLRLVVTSTDKYVVPDTPGATNTVTFGATGSRLVLPTLDLASLAFSDSAPTFE